MVSEVISDIDVGHLLKQGFIIHPNEIRVMGKMWSFCDQMAYEVQKMIDESGV